MIKCQNGAASFDSKTDSVEILVTFIQRFYLEEQRQQNITERSRNFTCILLYYYIWRIVTLVLILGGYRCRSSHFKKGVGFKLCTINPFICIDLAKKGWVPIPPRILSLTVIYPCEMIMNNSWICMNISWTVHEQISWTVHHIFMNIWWAIHELKIDSNVHEL